MGFIGEILGAGLNTALEITRPKRQYKLNKQAAEDSNKMNRENQQWLLEQQKSIQAEQREYDSPEQQMARYKAAGLNPHLIYGSGSSSGQAFPIDAGQVAPSRIDAPQASMPDIAGNYLALARGAASLDLTQQKTAESSIKTQAGEIQNEIAKTNPMLNPSVAAAVSDAMEQVALAKSQESFIMRSAQPDGNSLLVRKVYADVQALEQKLGLNTTDLAIKNKILESKEYDNAIREIQVKWLKDGSINSEHIRQGLMLLLSKMLGR